MPSWLKPTWPACSAAVLEASFFHDAELANRGVPHGTSTWAV
jgi:hypothetical protein